MAVTQKYGIPSLPLTMVDFLSTNKSNVIAAACVIQPSWTLNTPGSVITWSILDSVTNHNSIFFTSIAPAGAFIQLNYPAVSKVITFIVGADETFQKYGVVAGATVALNNAQIQMSIGGYSKPVSMTGNGSVFVGAPLTATFSGGTNTVSNIPYLGDSYPYGTIFTYYGSNNYIARPGPISGLSAGQMKFQLFDAATGALIVAAPTANDKVLVTLPAYPTPVPLFLFDGDNFAKKIYEANTAPASSTGNLWVFGLFQL